MRNFVPALEESLMKFCPSETSNQQPEATYTAHGGWFGMESFNFSAKSADKKTSKKRRIKGARA